MAKTETINMPFYGSLTNSLLALNANIKNASVGTDYTFANRANIADYKFAIFRLLNEHGNNVYDGFMVPTLFIPGNQITLSMPDGTYATMEFSSDGTKATLNAKTVSAGLYRINLL